MEVENPVKFEGDFKAIERGIKERAPCLYLALKFLPKKQKSPIFFIYAVFYIGAKTSIAVKTVLPHTRLTDLRETINRIYSRVAIDNGISSRLREISTQFQIPKQYFLDIIEGIELGLNPPHFQNFVQLQRYCFKKTGAFYLILFKILGSEDSRMESFAVNFGVAITLVDILGSVRKDGAHGKIYLPADEMMQYGIFEADIREGKANTNFNEMVKMNINRARRYCENATDGIKMLNTIQSRFAICLLKELYLNALTKLSHQGDNISAKDVAFSSLHEAFLILTTLVKGQYF